MAHIEIHEIKDRITRRPQGGYWTCICGKCGYSWNPRYDWRKRYYPLPKRCPGCHTRKWLGN